MRFAICASGSLGLKLVRYEVFGVAMEVYLQVFPHIISSISYVLHDPDDRVPEVRLEQD